MEVGNMLACLENNMNAKRRQKITVTKQNGGLKMKSDFRIAFPKPKKQFIARKFYDPKMYLYMEGMRENMKKMQQLEKKWLEPSVRKRMALVERDRMKLIK